MEKYKNVSFLTTTLMCLYMKMIMIANKIDLLPKQSFAFHKQQQQHLKRELYAKIHIHPKKTQF